MENTTEGYYLYSATRGGFLLVGGAFGTDLKTADLFGHDKAVAMAKRFNSNANGIIVVIVRAIDVEQVKP